MDEDAVMDDLVLLGEIEQEISLRRDQVCCLIAFEALDEALEAVRRAEGALRTRDLRDLRSVDQ